MSHESKLVTTPDGKTKVVYKRTEEQERLMEDHRLGKFSLIDPLRTSNFLEVLPKKNLVLQASYLVAQRAIRARLDLDKRSYMVLTGTQLVRRYLDQESSEESGSYFEGFPNFKQFYLLFGYTESKNRRLSELINEVINLRYTQGMHCWLFLSEPLEVLAGRWGDALLNLNYLPRVTINDINDRPGPQSTASVKEEFRQDVKNSVDEDGPKKPTEVGRRKRGHKRG